jgi:GTPase SAR1 family protein
MVRNLRIALIGPTKIGKSAFMIKAITGKIRREYIPTADTAVRTKIFRQTSFSVYDCEGDREYTFNGVDLVLIFVLTNEDIEKYTKMVGNMKKIFVFNSYLGEPPSNFKGWVWNSNNTNDIFDMILAEVN